jgi:prepilin-type processing-associated H-X9-DG protein
MGSGGTGPEPAVITAPASIMSNLRALSGLAAMLPFIEQQALWEQLSNPLDGYPAMGPFPNQDSGVPTGGTVAYRPHMTQVDTFRCPSDPIRLNGFAQTNYAFCYGDGGRFVGANFQETYRYTTLTATEDRGSKRGVFTRMYHFKFRDILDGTANTIAMGEIGVGAGTGGGREVWAYNIQNAGSVHMNPTLCKNHPSIDPTRPTTYRATALLANRGRRWAEGHISYTGFNTVLPPNSPSCRSDGAAGHISGVFSAGSYHQGGAHVLMADGAVRFITDSIEAGNASQGSASSVANPAYLPAGSPSPYGLWGALGTRGAKETPTLD